MSDLNAFMADLTSTKSSGVAKLWKLDLDKLAANKQKLVNLPLQARVVAKAIFENAGDEPFTFQQAADWSEAAGLETRQPALRIVRYYGAQLRECLISPAK
jgi:hypothetical protein